MLFIDGKCTELGHTMHMIGHQSKPMQIPRQAVGSAHTIGGIDLHPIIASMLQRMQCWVTLAVDVMQTEFSDTELLQSFPIFVETMGTSSAVART